MPVSPSTATWKTSSSSSPESETWRRVVPGFTALATIPRVTFAPLARGAAPPVSSATCTSFFESKSVSGFTGTPRPPVPSLSKVVRTPSSTLIMFIFPADFDDHFRFQAVERPSASTGPVERLPKPKSSASACHFTAAAFAVSYAVFASTATGLPAPFG